MIVFLYKLYSRNPLLIILANTFKTTVLVNKAPSCLGKNGFSAIISSYLPPHAVQSPHIMDVLGQNNAGFVRTKKRPITSALSLPDGVLAKCMSESSSSRFTTPVIKQEAGEELRAENHNMPSGRKHCFSLWSVVAISVSSLRHGHQQLDQLFFAMSVTSVLLMPVACFNTSLSARIAQPPVIPSLALPLKMEIDSPPWILTVSYTHLTLPTTILV